MLSFFVVGFGHNPGQALRRQSGAEFRGGSRRLSREAESSFLAPFNLAGTRNRFAICKSSKVLTGRATWAVRFTATNSMFPNAALMCTRDKIPSTSLRSILLVGRT